MQVYRVVPHTKRGIAIHNISSLTLLLIYNRAKNLVVKVGDTTFSTY